MTAMSMAQPIYVGRGSRRPRGFRGSRWCSRWRGRQPARAAPSRRRRHRRNARRTARRDRHARQHEHRRDPGARDRPEGNYRAVNLQPGPYTITAELTGFAPNKRTVTLLVGANSTVNIKLSVATMSENVMVSGESPLVEVAKAQPPSVIVGEQLAVLPVLDRNFLVLAQLLPGAAPLTGVNSRFAVTKFGGLADQRNGYTTLLDGGAIDDSTWGSPVINMPQDAVQEFKVFRNQFDAQYGAALNAVVNVVTKSGGNNPSGTGYYFGRDKSLNARNAKAATVPPFKQARIGGTYGGPIVQNRTHMFTAYEYLTIDKAAIVSLPASNPFAAQQNGNYPFNATEHLVDARIDHRINSAQSRFVRYAYDKQFTPSGGPENAVRLDHRQQQVAQRRGRAQLGAVAEHGQHPARALPGPQPVHRADQLRPADLRPSYTFGRTAWRRSTFPRKIGSLFETFYINTPRHDIKIGGEFTRASSNFEAHFTEHGAFTFLTDTPFNAADSRTWPFTFVQQTPGFYNYSSNQIAAFVQDDWRVTDRLRLNLGLRYDLDTSLRQNELYTDLLANPLYKGIERFVSADRGNDYNNLQPRFGATYDLRGNGTLVARAATGLYVTRNRPWLQQTSMDRTLGFAVRITDPLLLQNYPDITGVLGGRTLERVRQCRRRAVALPHRRRLRAALLVQHHGRHRLADQLRHLARRRLRAQRRQAPARHDRPQPAGKRRDHREPIRGRCRSSARWACWRTSPRAGTTRSRCSCARGCAAPTACRCPMPTRRARSTA